MQTKLQEESQKLYQNQRVFQVEVARQRALMDGHTDVERGLRMLIEGVEVYLRGLKEQHKVTPRTDHYLKGVAREITDGLSQLLNLSGQFDGGTCSRAIKLIEQEYGIEDRNY